MRQGGLAHARIVAPARSPHRRGADPEGRYDRRRGRTPTDGLASVPLSKNADTTVGAVVDPYGDGEERILATINRRVDILETERIHERISEAAYLTGRILGDGLSYADAATFEGKAGPRGTTFIAESFRCALEDTVSAVRQAQGAVSPAPDDKHAEAAMVADRLPSAGAPAAIDLQD